MEQRLMTARSREFTLTSILLAALALTAAGCKPAAKYPLDTLAPTSDITRAFYNLFVEVTVLDSIVLIIVIGALFLGMLVFSTRTGSSKQPSVRHSDIFLEFAWTVIPALILVAITIPTVTTIVRTQPYTWPKNTLPIEVIAHQWWWEFHYPTLGVETADELHIPTGQTIHFEMVSKDVIHSFFMPQVGGKRDVVPGQVNQITLIADVPGEYYGQCTEFCGDSHANMRFRVFVETPDQFKQWVAHQLTPPVKPQSGPAAAGAKIFANAPCAICHTIRGVSGFSKQYTYGFRGPDLTHFGSRATMAGSIMDNTPQNVARWIRNPDEIKPGANMPTLGLGGKEMNDLVAYLESLK
jgi:cytochrome c oxidase subunit II